MKCYVRADRKRPCPYNNWENVICGNVRISVLSWCNGALRGGSIPLRRGWEILRATTWSPFRIRQLSCIRPAWSMFSRTCRRGIKQKKIWATLSLPDIDAPAELFNVQAIDHPSRRHRKARITVAIMKIWGCTRRRFDFLADVFGRYLPSFRGFYADLLTRAWKG